MSSREERANVIVAQALAKLLRTKVEAEVKKRADGRLLDIYIPDLNAVLEAKYDDFDAACRAAQDRWEEMNPPPEIVGALSYDLSFEKDAEDAVYGDGRIEFALSGNPDESLSKFKRTGAVYDLAQSLRRPAAILRPNEDEIDKEIKNIEGAMTLFYTDVKNKKGLLAKFAEILKANFANADEEKILEQSARVAGLILFGALLFQFALSQKNPDVNSPDKLGLSDFVDEWGRIRREINYAAIFDVAEKLLRAGVPPKSLKCLRRAARKAQDLAEDGTDLMGRIYHRLLADAKPLGAFYTSIPAATMIAGLALPPPDWKNTDWAN